MIHSVSAPLAAFILARTEARIGGILLVLAGCAAVAAGLPALAVLVVWRRTEALRLRAAARIEAHLPERARPRQALPVLLWIADRAVRRKLLPWLVLQASGVGLIGYGAYLLVAG